MTKQVLKWIGIIFAPTFGLVAFISEEASKTVGSNKSCTKQNERFQDYCVR
ncbi:hypothetical protein [Hoylesella loescheii]|jgi:hypothetical protein|uniref:hypothetical protein n=1 Tax=Hoylesella loescheii TaxID=840 RepID=UPI00248E2CB5|nr:hypothetical protein [Hoylesella loescheii]